LRAGFNGRPGAFAKGGHASEVLSLLRWNGTPDFFEDLPDSTVPNSEDLRQE